MFRLFAYFLFNIKYKLLKGRTRKKPSLKPLFTHLFICIYLNIYFVPVMVFISTMLWPTEITGHSSYGLDSKIQQWKKNRQTSCSLKFTFSWRKTNNLYQWIDKMIENNGRCYFRYSGQIKLLWGDNIAIEIWIRWGSKSLRPLREEPSRQRDGHVQNP